jgi:hypothetical protein
LKKRKTQWRIRREVDVVNCKGFAEGGLFDIGVYKFFDHAGSLFVLRTTRLLADYETILLVLKETNTTKK